MAYIRTTTKGVKEMNYSANKRYLADLFREYWNDYLTIAVFCEHKGIHDADYAYRMINAGRRAHNLNADRLKRRFSHV